VISAVLAAVMIALLLMLSPLLVHRVFGGTWLLLVAALVAVAGAASIHVIRGLFSGQRRYGWYGTSLAAEGLARLVPSVVLVWVGIAGAGHGPAAFGFAFALGTLLAAATTAAGVRPGTPGPAAPVRAMARGVGFLAAASALSFLLANIAPVVLTSRLTGDPGTAASFVSLFVLARLPLFLFSPVQAFLLPSLTAAAERDDKAGVRRQIRTMMVLVGAIGLASVVGAAVAGPWAAQVFFNAPRELSALVAALLGLSTVIMILAQVLQPALVALGEHRVVMAAWIAGTAVFGALLGTPTDPLVAVLAAQLAGPAAVVLIMTRALRQTLTSSELRMRQSGYTTDN
jgi:O-antigen/teichoic acid export membrane protein